MGRRSAKRTTFNNFVSQDNLIWTNYNNISAVRSVDEKIDMYVDFLYNGTFNLGNIILSGFVNLIQYPMQICRWH